MECESCTWGKKPRFADYSSTQWDNLAAEWRVPEIGLVRRGKKRWRGFILRLRVQIMGKSKVSRRDFSRFTPLSTSGCHRLVPARRLRWTPNATSANELVLYPLMDKWYWKYCIHLGLPQNRREKTLRSLPCGRAHFMLSSTCQGWSF